MVWSSFWSAVIGGVLVIAGHVVVHNLQRRAAAEDRKTENDRRVVELVFDTVNWLETDKQVLVKSGIQAEPIGSSHPIHALVAALNVYRPDLNQQAEALMKSSRRYFDVTRILIPNSDSDKRSKLVDEIGNLSNGMMVTLNTILDSVVESVDSSSA